MSENPAVPSEEQIRAQREKLSNCMTILQKNGRRNRLAWAVFHVLLFLVIFFILNAVLYLLTRADPEDRRAMEELPSVLRQMNAICGKGAELILDFAARTLPASLPAWSVYVICCVVVLLFPALIGLVVKLITDAGEKEYRFREDQPIAECFSITYEKMTDNILCSKENYLVYAIVLGLYFGVLMVFVMTSLEGFALWMYLLIGVITGAAVFGVAMLLHLLTRWMLSNGQRKLPYNRDSLEKAWAEYDPEKKAELEERERKLEEHRERMRERQRLEREAESRKPTITFDATNASSANEIKVNVDGVQVCKLSGGSKRSIKLEPGWHTIQASVYNDASETYRTLDPLRENFEAYQDYTVDYS